ncbi:cobalt-precorrin 5A hydrolase [Alkalimarinus alittae]|uniref:Cobalamin biosynthesis protein n=1 Tax=Alkalimarinus alittae TaxID=2961619 RepID=A0ABY6N668_9ALTE|nr:cobalamin biosynthesis protein [Alkalimarinus alittae]UZE97487.1 cobalamin biosynthesis protein [Alkalimarinus alittae]
MIRIVSLTDAGQRLGERLQRKLPDSELWFKPKPFTETVQQAFKQGDRLILICATGIAVRTLAPVLGNKHQDPAVLVLDEQGQFVIPLLSGHEGGANDWANEVAEVIDGQLVMTTAKPYLRPIYTVGMGCERNCPEAELQQLLARCLSQAGLTLDSVDSISSIDIKADEVGLLSLAAKLGKPYVVWDKAQLATVESLLSTKSDYVFKTVGVYGVAESAALYSAQQHTGESAELVLVKQKTAKATCAIARSYPAADS